VARFWARTVLLAAHVKVRSEGLAHVPEKPPYLIVFNHQSDFDIYALMVGLPRLYRAVMKKELMYYPLVGWVIYFLGFVPIDRGNLKRAMKSLERAAARFQRYPYMMAITGTRVRNRDFPGWKLKKGPVVTAIRFGVPTLPVTLVGADDVHVKGMGLIHPGRTIEVVAHPVMDTSDWVMERRDEYVEQLRQVLMKPLIERGIVNESSTG